MTVDMSPKAVTARLRRVDQLREVARKFGRAIVVPRPAAQIDKRAAADADAQHPS